MKLTGLIGRPVTHSIGQTLYNKFFKAVGIDSMYLSMDITPENLERFTHYAREYFLGYNVTIPHKVHIMEFLDQVESIASESGAVNLVRNAGGKSTGYNTDYLAMEKAAATYDLEFDNSSVAIAGTGGVARTIIYFIASRFPTAEVTVFSREPEEARKKLQNFAPAEGCRVEGYDGRQKRNRYDVLINCSPVGMWPDTGKVPFTREQLEGCRAGMDLVYNPRETAFVRSLRNSGKITVDGTGFFIDQGCESLKILFGDHFDESKFRAVAEDVITESVTHG